MTPHDLMHLARNNHVVAIWWRHYLDGLYPSLEAALIQLVLVQTEINADLVNRASDHKMPLIEEDRQHDIYMIQLARYQENERSRRRAYEEASRDPPEYEAAAPREVPGGVPERSRSPYFDRARRLSSSRVTGAELLLVLRGSAREMPLTLAPSAQSSVLS
jgi:hypothetical protein